MGPYEVPLSMSLLGFGMRTMLVFNMLVRAYVFSCLMFSLSGHCELLFLLCFISSWT